MQNRSGSRPIIEAFAPAKVNLTLHVTGQRADGYHLLDSLVVFADVGDRLRLEAGPSLSLAVTGPFAEGVPTDQRNLAWRAAELAGWSGHIQLDKALPHGAGIGGGSSDAGAVLRALEAAGDAAELGADVPVCQLGRSTRMSGIGDVLDPVDIPVLWATLVNPGVPVPTQAVFQALPTKTHAPMTPMPAEAGEFLWWLTAQRNDLEDPARQVAPVIEDVLKALSATGAALARMSGSGATCFGLYDSAAAAQKAASAISADRPDWWVRPCQLGV